MQKFLLSLLLTFSFLCTVAADDVQRVAYVAEYAEREVIVMINAPSDYSVMETFSTNEYSRVISNQAETFGRSRGLEVRNTYPKLTRNSGISIIHLRSDNKSTDELIRELSSDPNVVSVQRNYRMTPDWIIPNDPYYDTQWGMRNINMPDVWRFVTGSRGIVVAVLDRGINYNHDDLRANMAIDSFGNHGRRFQNGIESGNPMDTSAISHGTHVAGIIGAEGNNNIGVTGVNWNVGLLAVNVLSGGNWISDAIDGMAYVRYERENGLNIRVANLSFGAWVSPTSDLEPFRNAVRLMSEAGIIIVMSAGNESQNISNPTGFYQGQIRIPMSFRFDNTIAVGSINQVNNGKSNFSNYGSQWVDIAAPGNVITSTRFDDSYGGMSGTSKAAPHVAGAAAILSAAFPNESASQIKARILSGARNIGVSHRLWAHGILDVWGAYQIPASVPLITTFNVPDGTRGESYNHRLIASRAATWSISGNLPPGLSLNPTTGVISGVPTTLLGTFDFTVRATNAAGSTTRNLHINIVPQAPPIITTITLPRGYMHIPYNQRLIASGTEPISWSPVGNLPPGLTLNQTTGVISGIPTLNGSFIFTVRATNVAGSATETVAITIVPTVPIVITTPSPLPGGTAGELYNQTLHATGPGPIFWSMAFPSNELPPILELSYNGVIAGLPTAAGTFDFTVRARNLAGSSTTKDFSINITPSLPGALNGYIEINGNPWMHDCSFILYCPSHISFKFVPIPSNAMINSIEWESSDECAIFIIDPDQIETEGMVSGAGVGPTITVTVNGTFTTSVGIWIPDRDE